MRSFFVPALIVFGLVSQNVTAQDVENTRAKPTDWEEINFETNQAVIVDGFPSLLRLAELLKAHPDFKLNVVGHTDQIGSNRANDRLSLRRANAVSQFLQRYGANASQITVSGEGKRNLEENARNANARFINRRVVLTVTAPDGTQIGDGGIGSAIVDFIAYARAQLGKIDSVSTAIQQLQTQVNGLNTSDIKQDTGQIRQDTASIKQDTASIKQDTSGIKQDTTTLVQRPAPLTAAETTQIAHDAGQQAADYALTQSAIRNRKYSLVGFDVGPTFGPGRIGNYSAEIFGKALVPFGNGKTDDQPGTHGFLVDGDWVYAHKHFVRTRREPEPTGLSDAVFNVGLLNRFGHVQIGTVAQFEYTSLNLTETRLNRTLYSRGGAFLGAGVVTLNYVFNGGTIGLFGAKGFKDSSNLTITNLGGTTPSFVRYDDQVGISAAGTIRYFQAESSVAYVKRHSLDRDQQPSAMLKLSFGPRDTLQFFVEGDMNTTINAFNYGYRVVAGFQFGNWVKARNFGSTQGVVPVTLPRPHYELLSR